MKFFIKYNWVLPVFPIWLELRTTRVKSHPERFNNSKDNTDLLRTENQKRQFDGR